jgi:hypothetical protein
MKNLFEVLRQKEQQVQQLQKEIEALRIAGTLLSENGGADEADAATARAVAAAGRGPQPLDAAKRWP